MKKLKENIVYKNNIEKDISLIIDLSFSVYINDFFLFEKIDIFKKIDQYLDNIRPNIDFSNGSLKGSYNYASIFVKNFLIEFERREDLMYEIGVF